MPEILLGSEGFAYDKANRTLAPLDLLYISNTQNRINSEGNSNRKNKKGDCEQVG